MFRLRLLGGYALEDDGGKAVGHLPQRRAEAVLVFLAVAGEHGCRRERLIGLLWPDSDDDRGRHCLRDALHAIRQALGGDAIVADGADLRLAPSVECDVRTFSDLVASSHLADAVALYRGPLLDGFQLEHAAEFERWIEDERGRFHRECAHAVERLAITAEEEERWRDAAHWWTRAEELDPYSTPVVVCRMRALTRAGDRANALRVGEAHRQRLLKELELEPDAGLVDEIASLRAGERIGTRTVGASGGRPPSQGGEPSLDTVFLALQDPTRRAVVEQLSERPASLCTLERFLAIPQPEIRQYVQALESSGLVRPRQEGTVRRYRVNLSWLRAAERWIAEAAGRHVTSLPPDRPERDR